MSVLHQTAITDIAIIEVVKFFLIIFNYQDIQNVLFCMSGKVTMSESLRQRIQEDMKTALRAQDKQRLGAIRLILADIRKREIDERITLNDEQVFEVFAKMLKQRRDSLEQYETAGRQDLVAQESFEIALIQSYMPKPLDETELNHLIDTVLKEIGATSSKDMGNAMKVLKKRTQGRADMKAVSVLVKQRLN